MLGINYGPLIQAVLQEAWDIHGRDGWRNNRREVERYVRTRFLELKPMALHKPPDDRPSTAEVPREPGCDDE